MGDPALAFHLTEADFRFFQIQIKRLTGIHLSDAKHDLLQGRLVSRLLKLGISTCGEYRHLLENLPPNDREWQLFVNIFTTNKTEFYREAEHFRFLREEFLPEWRAKGHDILQVWSAAAATGEEVYTLAMLLQKELGPAFHILGSDIDTEALSIAKNGVYPLEKLRALPAELRDGTYRPGHGAVKDWGRINDVLRERVEFQQINLAAPHYPVDNVFDVIFCRNVFIYFEKPLIEEIINTFYDHAHPDALLFIGHTETLQGLETPWKNVGPSIFQKTR